MNTSSRLTDLWGIHRGGGEHLQFVIYQGDENNGKPLKTKHLPPAAGVEHVLHELVHAPVEEAGAASPADLFTPGPFSEAKGGGLRVFSKLMGLRV